MKNEETLGNIAIGKVNTTLQPLWRSVVPIFRVGDAREPEAFGSAVLIELAGQRFLVTARHVVDEYLKSRIHTIGASGYVVIAGDFFCTPEAGLDVAVLRLDGELEDELAGHVFLTEADILPADQYDDINLLTLIGYPGSQSRVNRKTKKVRTQCYSIGVRVLSVAGAILHGAFLRKRNRDGRSGLKVTAPDLHGMSGGGMFAIKVTADASENQQPKLAAISTTWHERRNEVIGTKIAIAMAIIRDAYGIAVPDVLGA